MGQNLSYLVRTYAQIWANSILLILVFFLDFYGYCGDYGNYGNRTVNRHTL